MSEKTCSKCKQTKPLSAFHKNAGNGDGLRYECKDCRKKIEVGNNAVIHYYLTKHPAGGECADV